MATWCLVLEQPGRGGAGGHGSVLLAVPAALAIARHEFPGRQALNGLLMSPLIVPHLVLGVAMLRLFALLDVRGSALWLTLAHVVIVTPYALRLMVAALAGADPASNRPRSRWVPAAGPCSAASRCR
jgi:ABC-type spermidine/putrescine transport system permease subunit II